MKFDNIKSLLDEFSKLAQKGSGQVTIEQFAAHLNVPVSEPLREMFDLYDRVSYSVHSAFIMQYFNQQIAVL